MSIIEIGLLIAGFVLGAGSGGLVAWLWKSLKVRAEMAELQKDLVVSKSQVVELTKQNAELQQKCVDAQSALANTLSALELLKAYQLIDSDTKNSIKDIQNTFVDGKASEDTMKKYKEMLQNMNKSFSDYNKGQTATK